MINGCPIRWRKKDSAAIVATSRRWLTRLSTGGLPTGAQVVPKAARNG